MLSLHLLCGSDPSGPGQRAQAARGRGPERARGPREAAEPREPDLGHGEVRERARRR